MQEQDSKQIRVCFKRLASTTLRRQVSGVAPKPCGVITSILYVGVFQNTAYFFTLTFCVRYGAHILASSSIAIFSENEFHL